MIFRRGVGGGSDPVDGEPVAAAGDHHEYHHAQRSSYLASATLACPSCDAPVALSSRALTPGSRFACPFCDHAGSVRDFLSLAQPTRATHVELHVVLEARVRPSVAPRD